MAKKSYTSEQRISFIAWFERKFPDARDCEKKLLEEYSKIKNLVENHRDNLPALRESIKDAGFGKESIINEKGAIDWFEFCKAYQPENSSSLKAGDWVRYTNFKSCQRKEQANRAEQLQKEILASDVLLRLEEEYKTLGAGDPELGREFYESYGLGGT